MELVKDLGTLEVGDEIITTKSSGQLVLMKILSKPAPSRTRTHWSTKKPLYKAIKVSCKVDSETFTYATRSYTRSFYTVAPPEEHNVEKRIDLNYKDVLLIKKANDV